MTNPHQPPPAHGGRGPSPYLQGTTHPQQHGQHPSGMPSGHTSDAPYGQTPDVSYVPGAPANPGAPYTPGQPHTSGAPYAHVPGTPVPGSYLEATPRPISVWLAALLLWAQSALLLMGAITALIVRANVDQAPQPGGATMFGDLASVLAGTLMVLAAIAIATAVVLVLLTIGAFRGNNACRWTLIVLYGLALLSTVPLLAILVWEVSAPAADFWGVPMLIVMFPITVVVLLLLPGANAWYRQRSAQATMGRQQAY